MIHDSGESEQMRNSKKDWIYFAKLCAEEFKIIRNKAVKEQASTDEAFNINKYLTSQSDWSRKINNYLSSPEQQDTKRSRKNIAANLAVSSSNPEEKLITAIVLAREGYFICALAAASDILKRKELARGDRLDAFMTVLENITTNKPITHGEWLYTSKLNIKIVKILNLLLDLYQNKEELDELSRLMEDVQNLESEEGATKFEITEKTALHLAINRKSLSEELFQAYDKPIIRSIHHFACTGGTVISKCLASMHNVALVSEVNPMNRYDSKFTPTNPLLLLERSFRTFTTEEKIDIFKMQIAKAMQLCQKEDVDLILRDHSHTDFCKGSKESDMCAIKDHLSEDYHLIHVLTVRHPLDSYLSLIENGWEDFQPSGINEYSRRYLAFINKYRPSEIMHYEEFCEDPPEFMRKLCSILRIGYDKRFLNTFGEKNLSGDSGRRGIKTIEKRSRKPTPSRIKSQIENSEYYAKLIDTLSY